MPLTFHTDGTWVWSGAVAYYLTEHGVPPEPDLVAHIRAAGSASPRWTRRPWTPRTRP
ncbi:hypothetical protein ACFQY7_50440 [Actinomadura luteofluorescens]|uniref:hypothetical protein n=1 Tax=Actinomadura luteofluorescens TaxID=46163 RepID=UPI0036287BD9